MAAVTTDALRCWRRLLSVRHIVALLTAAFLVAAGGDAIALVVPAAVARLRALGEQQATLLAQDALRSVQQLYAAPMHQLDTLTNAATIDKSGAEGLDPALIKQTDIVFED